MDHEELADILAAHGGTDRDYLKHHFPRFKHTLDEFLRGWPPSRGARVLDVGAHWLHQSLLWRRAGFSLTAVDLPVTLDMQSVQSLAAAEGIQLIKESNLAEGAALATLPDDGFDVVLMAETIEHLTFNPVAMWRQVYRVLRPGGRIVVTTPNYYALRGRAWNWPRFRQGFGGGIDVHEILHTMTYGHHWKEYALRELIYYFCVLSEDFNCVKALHVEEYAPGYMAKPATWMSRQLERRIPLLRPNLHVEIEIRHKQSGIRVAPGW